MQTLLLILIYISFISLGLPDSLLGSGWPSMYALFGVPLHFAGYVSLIIALGTVVSSMMSARIIRRFGTGAVTAFSVTATALALLGFSFSREYVWLCLCAVPLGLGAGSVDAALNNYVALHFKARHMSWLHCFWGIGASAGPLIMSSYLTASKPWYSGYRAVSIIQFSLAAVLIFSLPLWRGKKNADSGSAETARHLKLSEILRIRAVKPALAAFFCYCSIETTAGLWGASFLVTVKNISPETAARWTALYYSGITADRFLSGFLTLKFTSRQMVRLGQGTTALGIAVLLLPLGNAALLAGFFMIGLGCAPVYPGLLHETPANFGAENSQSIMGVQMASAYVGTTLAPPLFGRLASITGFGIFPFFIAALLALKVFMTETVNRKTGGK